MPIDELPDEVDDAPTPEDRAIQDRDVESATKLLSLLPKILREVMLLRVAAGLPGEEAGAALGMTAGAVRVAQHRALAKMREHANQSQDVGHAESLQALLETDELISSVADRRTVTSSDPLVGALVDLASGVDAAAIPEYDVRPPARPLRPAHHARQVTAVLAIGLMMSSTGIAAASAGDPLLPIRVVACHIHALGKDRSDQDSNWIFGAAKIEPRAAQPDSPDFARSRLVGNATKQRGGLRAHSVRAKSRHNPDVTGREVQRASAVVNPDPKGARWKQRRHGPTSAPEPAGATSD